MNQANLNLLSTPEIIYLHTLDWFKKKVVSTVIIKKTHTAKQF